jgi:hypothetical protein
MKQVDDLMSAQLSGYPDILALLTCQLPDSQQMAFLLLSRSAKALDMWRNNTIYCHKMRYVKVKSEMNPLDLINTNRLHVNYPPDNYPPDSYPQENYPPDSYPPTVTTQDNYPPDIYPH